MSYKIFISNTINKFKITYINNRQLINKEQVKNYKQFEEKLKINYLMTQQVCQYLNISENTLYLLYKNKKLCCECIIHNCIHYYNKAQIVEYISNKS